MIAELEFIPLPANTELFEENVQYIVLDSDQNHHGGPRDSARADSLWTRVIATTTDTAADA